MNSMARLTRVLYLPFLWIHYSKNYIILHSCKVDISTNIISLLCPFITVMIKPLCNLIYRLGDAIGSGQFGNVRSAVWLKDDGQKIEVALKTLQEGATKQEKIKFLQEAVIMSQFNHSNVIKLHGMVIDENSVCLMKFQYM